MGMAEDVHRKFPFKNEKARRGFLQGGNEGACRNWSGQRVDRQRMVKTKAGVVGDGDYII